MEIARLDPEPAVGRARQGRHARVGAAAVGAVGGGVAVREGHLADLGQHRRQIFEPLGDDVDDVAFALHAAPIAPSPPT